MNTPDPRELHTRASALFGEQVASIQDHEWDLPTPCSDWNVQEVVAHVVIGDSQIPPLFAGERVDSITDVNPSALGTNPMATWRGTAVAAITALSEVSDLDATVQHPLGEIPGRRVVGFRLSDSLVHAWDLASGLTRPIELPGDLAEWCLEFWQPMATDLAASGFFAPALHPPEDSSAADRLLSLLGRSV
jgi:uncharacterized protein (TIGR03086 family)